MPEFSKSVTIIIPCYNEEEALKKFLPEVLSIAVHNKWDVIAVDDGSSDGSRIVLEEFTRRYPNLNVIAHSTNKGYGAALKTGIAASRTGLTATLDADGQHNPLDLNKLISCMYETRADMVIGSRTNQLTGGAYRSAGRWIIRKVARILTRVKVSDLNSGMKLFDTQVAKKMLAICPDSMAFSDIIALSFASEKYLVKEEPIIVRERTLGESTVGFNTAVDTVFEILNIVMLFNPIRIFLPISVILFLLGLLWGIPIILAGRGVSVGAGLLMLTGVMVFLLGLIAEQLSLIRKSRR